MNADGAMSELPAVVSQRNHFDSVGSLVDLYWQRVPVEHRTEALRKFLLSYTKSVVNSVARNFVTGAERGIEQTAKLIIDPTYYETLKERRKREKVRHDEYQKAQEQEQHERRLAPTTEQIEREETDLHLWIAQSHENIERCQERLKYLATLKNRPKHVRITEAKPKPHGDINREPRI
jgi:hypothetical protein